MKIIVEHGELGHPYAATLQYCGYNVKFWTQNKSLIDIYDEFQPDLILYEFKSHQLFKQLSNIIQCKTTQIPIYYVLPANPVQLLGTPEDKYRCDVVLLDFQLPSAAGEIAQKIFDGGFKVKLFAGNLLNSPFQLGVLASYQEYGAAIASSEIVVDITNRWGLDAWMNGKISLEEAENELDKSLDTVYNNYEDLVQKVKFLLDNPKKRASIVKSYRERVADNTYFQDIAKIFHSLDLIQEKEHVLKVFNEKVRNLLR